jgi:hypothetical protein
VRATVAAVELRARPDDHLELAAAARHRPAGQLLDFIQGQHRRFAGGAGDDDAVGAFAQVEIQQAVPSGQSRRRPRSSA